jgi:hypothetical protein
MITEYMGVHCKSCRAPIPVEQICQSTVAIMTTKTLDCRACKERHEYGYQDQYRFTYDDNSREVKPIWSLSDGPPLPPPIGYSH